MVFKKRSKRSSNYGMRKRSRGYGRGRYSMRTASRYTLRNIVDTVVQRTTELKYLTLAGSLPFNVAGPSYITDISAVTQGQTDTTRIGDRLQFKNITLRYLLYDSGVSVTANSMNHVRVFIFSWAPYVTVAPLATDVFLLGGVISPPNHDSRQMYKIHYDRQHQLVGATTKAMQTFVAQLKIPKKFQQCQFSAGTTNRTNGLYLGVIVTSSGAGVTGVLTYNTTVRYTDA